ncbi:YlbF family regulator [Haloplasma contractile]|uniref:Regulatory protein YlbF n=1 Tax=Haloplasma contractile SSD-17B TaxID=1033810 RepID=U2FR82_9MOLU|nr:YlbF family regulator [Haloplasma contractile]ERJ13489.1 Regulatory protein YlbF [Haloplasma contractile SSD-17B]
MNNQLIYEAAYELSERIKNSTTYKDFIRCERELSTNDEIKKILADFNRKKEQLEEAKKYGNYYPGYDKVVKAFQESKINLMKNPVFKEYKQKEKQLDHILYQVTESISTAVSENVKFDVKKHLFNL